MDGALRSRQPVEREVVATRKGEKEEEADGPCHSDCKSRQADDVEDTPFLGDEDAPIEGYD